MSFIKVSPKDVKGNIIDLTGNDWMLITAGDAGGFNSMTAAWGAAGSLWGKDVAFCYIRPHRYTYDFMEANDYYTLSFYPEKYRDLLGFSGTFGGKSGRDIDKVAESGFTPVYADCGAVYYEQAELVLVCKKIYADDVRPDKFTTPVPADMYPDRDYHRIYIGEIIEVLEKK
ncbi:MAG: flavin reductase [Oscillospiraceae bacterium]|jgi:flavin reductase (DIM6/NTAB) family NADH-FMN oxidoreductase RutF|nr:flavin reductase [Oscillospiraceae bacterium]